MPETNDEQRVSKWKVTSLILAFMFLSGIFFVRTAVQKSKDAQKPGVVVSVKQANEQQLEVGVKLDKGEQIAAQAPTGSELAAGDKVTVVQMVTKDEGTLYRVYKKITP